MSEEIILHVKKGTKVRVFEDGEEVQPRMSDEQFQELLKAIRDNAPQQMFIPVPIPQPITIPWQPWWYPPVITSGNTFTVVSPDITYAVIN